jgi:hypothetical protein
MQNLPSHSELPLQAAEILDVLALLDERLQAAVASVRSATGAGPEDDPFRGLYVGDRDVDRMLAAAPGQPTLMSAPRSAGGTPTRLAAALPKADWLTRAFGLSSFDLDLILITLAPEVDLRYERIYAYLQNDVTRKRPTVDLALSLLSASAEDKLTRRRHLSPEAPLVAGHLVHLDTDPAQSNLPLLARTLRLDEQVVRFLLGGTSLDSRLVGFSELVEPSADWAALPLDEPTRRALPALVQRATAARAPLRLVFLGRYGSGRRAAAAALAAGAGRRLLAVDLVRALPADADGQLLKRVFREAWFLGTALYLDGIDTISNLADERTLVEELRRGHGLIILAAEGDWRPLRHPWVKQPLELHCVRFLPTDAAAAERGWRQALTAHGVADSARLAGVLASRLRSTQAQMADTVAEAVGRQRWAQATQGENDTADGGPALSETDLLLAAQETEDSAIAGLATRINPVHHWDDIVLPELVRAQLEELCDRVVHRRRVMSDWGFERKLSLGRGVTALFTGPSGTGKTMAAGVIARATGLMLYRIDLSGVVSKYIGETEKNLDRIFAAAEGTNAILCFDEADALFGKRSEVRDAHDRYANIEISYLLQKMDSFEGLAILATNLRQNLDAAFTRRMSFLISFPMPDVHIRRLIWQRVWPAGAPLATDVDIDDLAGRFRLSGGNIRNIALAAAFLAAADGRAIGRDNVLHAIRREYQKMGKALSEAELTGDGSPPEGSG